MIPHLAPPKKPIKLSKEKTVLEKDIEDDNRRYALSKGCMFEKFTSPSRRSVPDRMLTCPNGLIAFFEYKAPGKIATPKQWQDHQDRRSRKVLVYVVDNAALGRRRIDDLIDMDRHQDAARKGWWMEKEITRHRAFYLTQSTVEG